jgi:hypothetical protein
VFECGDLVLELFVELGGAAQDGGTRRAGSVLRIARAASITSGR